MQTKFYVLLIFAFIGMCITGINAQSNKKEVSLLHFTMPDNVPVDGAFTIQGYVKNTGNSTIPHGVRVKYMMKAPIGNTSEDNWHMTEFLGEELPHLHEGDSVYVERTFQATSDVFMPDNTNIVILWPTVNLVDDRDEEIERHIMVDDGTTGPGTFRVADDSAGATNVPDDLTKIRVLIPSTRNQDAALMECYDSDGILIVRQTITDKTDNSHLFSLYGLVEGEGYTIVIKDAQGNILQQTPIRKR